MGLTTQLLSGVSTGVLAAGAGAAALFGLILTNNVQAPVGAPISFFSPQAVEAYFGATSLEGALASTYFAGYNGAIQTPFKLFFANYPTTSISGWLRGASVTLTPAQIAALSPATMTIVIDGVSHTSASINFSGVTTYSGAAAIMATALGVGTVTFNALTNAFQINSGTTGASSSVAYPTTNALMTSLGLTQAAGAILSSGAVAATPIAYLNQLQTLNTQWRAFTTTFEPNTADKANFANWISQQNGQYTGALIDSDPTVIASSSSTSCAGAQIAAAGYSGTVLFSSPNQINFNLGALYLGYLASLNYPALNGRQNFFGIGQSGITPEGLASNTQAQNASANGYNIYDLIPISNQVSQAAVWPGQISGKFLWTDSFANQLLFASDVQAACVNYMLSAGQIVYTPAGYGAIDNVLTDGPIQDAVNFGVIRKGVTLSTTQATRVTSITGNAQAVSIIQSTGFFLSIKDPGPVVRAARGSPIIIIFYCDGQSVQQMNPTITEVQ